MELLKLNLVLTFQTGLDEFGDIISSKVTLSNLRLDLTASELLQIAMLFNDLITHTLLDANVVQTSVLIPE